MSTASEMKKREKRNRTESKEGGYPRKVLGSPTIYFPPRETFFRLRNVFAGLRPSALGKMVSSTSDPQWDD
jgi:hypothetical protein